MLAAERRTAPLRGRNAQYLPPRLLWLLAPGNLAALGLAWFAFAPHWTWAREALCGLLGLTSLLFGLALVSQERFWWAPRVLAALVTLACVAAVYRVLLFPMAGDTPRTPALFLASVAFMVWGLPCLCFALWGHTRGKLARLDARHVTRMDRWTAHLLPALAWATGIALAVYLIRLLL